MGKKGNSQEGKKKMTKKEKKAANHLKLVHGKKGGSAPAEGEWNKKDEYKKSA